MQTFTSFKAFQNHRGLKHTTQLLDSDDHSLYNDVDSSEAVPHILSLSHSSKWILKIGETRKLTKAATLGKVEDVSDLVAFV